MLPPPRPVFCAVTVLRMPLSLRGRTPDDDGRRGIRPTISYGVGQDLGTGNGLALYEIGARSQYRIPVREGEVSIANALLFSGNNPRDGDDPGILLKRADAAMYRGQGAWPQSPAVLLAGHERSGPRVDSARPLTASALADLLRAGDGAPAGNVVGLPQSGRRPTVPAASPPQPGSASC